jgi:hypothetical protein
MLGFGTILLFRDFNYLGIMKLIDCMLTVTFFFMFLPATVALADWTNALPADVEAVLHEGETFTLYSLDPERYRHPPKNGFHAWKVLGTATITNAQTRNALLTAFEEGIAEARQTGECFEPRHAIRVTKGKKTIDLTICFHCRRVYIYEGNTPGVDLWITKSPEPVFDKALRDAHVQLPKKSEPN